IHFEVYRSVADATSSGNAMTTSRIALPEAVCDEVYATDGHPASVTNTSRTSLTSGSVFGDDGGVRQNATVGAGLVAALTVPVA
ncbi:MAG: hypothetical protein QOF00_686, partial [Pseudonocardiales bacterium]|nr:hypothetical protein [Pseudonocardiales bacterium]